MKLFSFQVLSSLPRSFCVSLKFLLFSSHKQPIQSCHHKLHLFQFYSSLIIISKEINDNRIWTVHYLVIAPYILIANLLCIGNTASSNYSLVFFTGKQTSLERDIHSRFSGKTEDIFLIYPPKTKLHTKMHLYFIRQLKLYTASV